MLQQRSKRGMCSHALTSFRSSSITFPLTLNHPHLVSEVQASQHTRDICHALKSSTDQMHGRQMEIRKRMPQRLQFRSLLVSSPPLQVHTQLTKKTPPEKNNNQPTKKTQLLTHNRKNIAKTSHSLIPSSIYQLAS